MFLVLRSDWIAVFIIHFTVNGLNVIFGKAALIGTSCFGRYIIVWLCLARTGNYRIHELDIERVLDFPIYCTSVTFCGEKIAN